MLYLQEWFGNRGYVIHVYCSALYCYDDIFLPHLSFPHIDQICIEYIKQLYEDQKRDSNYYTRIQKLFFSKRFEARKILVEILRKLMKEAELNEIYEIIVEIIPKAVDMDLFLLTACD